MRDRHYQRIDKAVAGRTLILDGGMGQELAARGLATSDGRWSVRALLDDPEAMVAVHRDFVNAGADVITTNSYAATRRRLDSSDIEDGFTRCNRAAGALARRASGVGLVDGRRRRQRQRES